VGKKHSNHLRDTLLRSYELTTDWEGKVYSGMSLKWDYKNRTCNISMPGYLANFLSKFQHDTPKQPQHTPYRYITPVYRAKTQYAKQDEPPPLPSLIDSASTYKKSQDTSCTMQEQWTPPYQCPSMALPLNKQKQLRKFKRLPTNC
jgi:hypothetical protein